MKKIEFNKEKTKKLFWNSVTFIVVVILQINLNPSMVFGQISVASSSDSKLSNPDELIQCFREEGDFTNSYNSELLPELKGYLDLTDAQVKQLQELWNRYQESFVDLKGLDYLRNGRDRYHHPFDERKFKNKIKQEDVASVSETRKFINSVGNEKFLDLILWLKEQTIVN